MSKRKQQTLGYFRFTKKVDHHGKEQEVKIPNFIDADRSNQINFMLALSTEIQKPTRT